MRRSPGSDIGGVTLLVTIIVGGINVTSGNRHVCVQLGPLCQILPAPHSIKESTQNPSGETQVLFHRRLIYTLQHTGRFPLWILGTGRKV